MEPQFKGHYGPLQFCRLIGLCSVRGVVITNYEIFQSTLLKNSGQEEFEMLEILVIA